jgi:hypothetical protein
VFVGDPSGDVAQLIGEIECGISVAVGDSERLAKELRRLRDNPGEVLAMGQRARAAALVQCTSSHAVTSWIRMLERVAPQILGAPLNRSA